ncbi:MAG TPA: AMP-binding protein, partial [Beijerinckiaceae bacterium]|nr:AMP-binding protein [Beijerinckiaceae bacterium]
MSGGNWQASYPPGVPASIDVDAFQSLHALLLDACVNYADKPAYSCLGTTLHYREWERSSRSFAVFLRESLQCRQGDRIALMLPNILAYPIAFLGALRAGLVVVNVNP